MYSVHQIEYNRGPADACRHLAALQIAHCGLWAGRWVHG
jgi:hypothetical protein